jgi:1-phosphofructokinase family hexose kinase
MILTLTPNPTIDRVIFCRGFRLGGVVRAERETVVPSGKGVDASLVIHELGGDTLALGLSAGLNGRLHAGLLDEWGIAHDMASASGETRMAIVLVDLAVNEQSTISAPTLTAREDSLERLLDRVERHARRSWGLICGGSLPPGLPEDSYARLIRAARARGLVTLLDTSGTALRLGVRGLPHVLKVNGRELRALDDVPWTCELDGDPSALGEWLGGRLGEWASEAIVITLGGRGALAATTGGTCRVMPPRVPEVNTAGAGDALGAGILLARSRGQNWPAALALGAAAAASVVMNEGTAICRREQVEELLPHVQVEVFGR